VFVVVRITKETRAYATEIFASLQAQYRISATLALHYVTFSKPDKISLRSKEHA